MTIESLAGHVANGLSQIHHYAKEVPYLGKIWTPISDVTLSSAQWVWKVSQPFLKKCFTHANEHKVISFAVLATLTLGSLSFVFSRNKPIHK